jgi:hypothetical protein
MTFILFVITKTLYFSLPFVKCEVELNSSLNLLMIKCLLTNVCLFVYTFHLCLTTICTPQMYFNWFLIIENCEYTYSTFQ